MYEVLFSEIITIKENRETHLLERLGLLCRLVLGEVYLILIVFAVSTLVYGISFSSASVSPCVPCISNSRCRRSSSGNRLFLASEGDLDRDLE